MNFTSCTTVRHFNEFATGFCFCATSKLVHAPLLIKSLHCFWLIKSLHNRNFSLSSHCCYKVSQRNVQPANLQSNKLAPRYPAILKRSVNEVHVTWKSAPTATSHCLSANHPQKKQNKKTDLIVFLYLFIDITSSPHPNPISSPYIRLTLTTCVQQLLEVAPDITNAH